MAEPTVSDQFIEYLKRVEGQSGLQPEGHYVPAASLEGGSPTIGYGHKLGPGEHVESMGQESAIALLKDDARYAELLARRRVDSAFGEGIFGAMDANRRRMLTDFAFNLGPSFADKFPKLTRAIVENDLETARNESRRYYSSPNSTKPIELTHRNDLFLKTFLPHTAAAEGGL